MGDLFRAPLTEHYRPHYWDEVVGQEKIVNRLLALRKRGLAGRAFWVSGQSGTGKTTIARLIAAEVADEFCIVEVDAAGLTVAALRDLEREMHVRGWGEKGGRAYVINEAHGLRKDVIRHAPREETCSSSVSEKVLTRSVESTSYRHLAAHETRQQQVRPL